MLKKCLDQNSLKNVWTKYAQFKKEFFKNNTTYYKYLLQYLIKNMSHTLFFTL